MIEGQEIRIRLLTGPPKAWLRLQGTVVTLRERFWSREVSIDIPLELTSIRETRRRKGSRLIAALLALLVGPGLGGGAIGLWYLVSPDVPEAAQSTCMLAGLLGGFLLFLILLVRFFIRQRVVSIVVAPRDTAISFWLDADRRQDLVDLMGEISARKAWVAESVPYPMRIATIDTVVQPWKRTVGLMILCSFPALVTEIPWLLFASAIPLGMHAYAQLRSLAQPALFRKAFGHFVRRDWSRAKALVMELLAAQPGYVPARMLLVELLMRLEDFAGAHAAFAEIEGQLDVETRQSAHQEMILRARISERKRAGIGRPPALDLMNA
jgi:hypothetical protein